MTVADFDLLIRAMELCRRQTRHHKDRYSIAADALFAIINLGNFMPSAEDVAALTDAWRGRRHE